MFRSSIWFAWRPVVASDNGERVIAWLQTVWRDQTIDKSGKVVATRYYV